MAGQTTQKANPPTAIQGFREGSRWIHQKPSGDELAEWFKTNVTIHDGLEHKNYITGIVLIPSKEKDRQTAANGNIFDQERLTFTPYPTTGARIAYLRDWIAAEQAKRDESLLWEIVPDPSLKRNDSLPGGFFAYTPVWQADGRDMKKPYVGCSLQLIVYERDIREGGKGRPILISPVGSKIVPMISWGKADDNALMKAQTGAVGRTLAFAGMLVIPGTGVATAEDIQESFAQGVPMSGTGPEQAALPVEESTSEAPPAQAEKPADLRQQAAELIGSLQAFPEKLAEVHAWARERDMMTAEATSLDVGGIPEPALRGAVRLLERKLADGEKAKAKAEPTEKPKPLDTGQSTDN